MNLLIKANSFFLFLFYITIPLKENWSSISLIGITLFSLIYFIKIKSKYSFSKKIFSQKKIFFFIVIIISIFSLFSYIFSFKSENTDFNSLSFPLLLTLFFIAFYFRIFKIEHNKKIFIPFFIGIGLSGFYKVYIGAYNSLILGTPFLFTRIEMPLENLLSSNPIIYSVFINFFWIYILVNFFKKNIKKKHFIILSVVVILFHLTNFTLIGALVFFISLLVIYVFFKANHLYKALSCSIIFFFTVIFIFILTPSGRELLIKVDGDPSRARNHKMCLHIIEDLPVLGFGVGNEFSTLQKYRSEKIWEYIKKYNAHNQYFEFILGGGFIYLILYVVLFLLLFRYSLIKNKIILSCFLLMIFLTMFVESLLIIHKGFLFVSYFAAYLVFKDDE